MSVFYNECVDDANKTKIDDILQVQPLLNNKKFITAFDRATQKTSKIRLDFANAYNDALDIVNYRRTSFNNAVNIVKNAINDVVDKIKSSISNDDLSKMSDLVQNISNANLNIDHILGNVKINEK